MRRCLFLLSNEDEVGKLQFTLGVCVGVIRRRRAYTFLDLVVGSWGIQSLSRVLGQFRRGF